MELTDGLKAVVEGRDLTEAEAKDCMDRIMGGEATPAQIGGFLVALRMKGETVAEITGCARTMREKVTRVDLGPGIDAIDTCGTGGDGTCTVNVSTLAALVAAGAGVKVAKHGNRSVSSSCGSADLLEALGVKIALGPEQVAACVRTAGIGFMFAPGFHAAMKHAIGPRKEMKIRTVFNILGPLTNPAGVKRQVIGVFSSALVDPIAEVLRRLGAEEALVVHGAGGMDEFSLSGPTAVAHLKGGRITRREVTPEDCGLKRSDVDAIRVPNAAEGKCAALDILNGKAGGPMRDVIVLNAAAALMVAGKVRDYKEGASLAAQTIASGVAKAALDRLVAESNR
ncbi:MAG: anthranilate phosphoribosyltransferase [Planctomycetota bacterium]